MSRDLEVSIALIDSAVLLTKLICRYPKDGLALTACAFLVAKDFAVTLGYRSPTMAAVAFVQQATVSFWFSTAAPSTARTPGDERG